VAGAISVAAAFLIFAAEDCISACPDMMHGESEPEWL
jgi:hypothetical protein